MRVFRITLAKWANTLVASGYPGRWNAKGFSVIYTSGSQALACLENLVHRSGEGLNDIFRVIEIEVPDKLNMDSIQLNQLSGNWTEGAMIPFTQEIGNKWIKSQSAVVLKVPSAIISREFNYLLNPNHPDFETIKIIGVYPFEFDVRFKL